ncbi:hypothetical protein BHM03_00053106 [Ensete ventricosum]|nr:hypothetical protein BHM03_00053106 [Ensete ventricosum]
MPPPSLPLRRRRLPFAAGSYPAKGRPPLRTVSPPLLAVGLAAAGSARGWLPLTGCCPCGRPPLAGGLAAVGRSLQVTRLSLAAPTGGLAVASHLYMQTACIWLPLPRMQRRLSLLIAATSTEIVYPCIPYPDREDEGGQASSSLAVSTRWISSVKLLQSDLTTLAQKEGGE